MAEQVIGLKHDGRPQIPRSVVSGFFKQLHVGTCTRSMSEWAKLSKPNINSQMGTTVPVRISSHIVEHGVLVSNIGEVIRFKRYHNSSLAYVTSMPSLVS